MSYIIFDLEWNQPFTNEALFLRKAGRPLSGEIIQIGAVKVDDQFEIIDTFNIIVKPQILLNMHKHVSKLTGIKTEDIMLGIPFPKAYAHFIKWCGDSPILFSWANDDIRVMRENCKLHKLKTMGDYTWYDAQVIYSYLRDGSTKQISLNKAIEQEAVPRDLQAHNALYDAMYTARILGKLPIIEGMAVYDEKLRALDTLMLYPDPVAFHVYEGFKDKRTILTKEKVRTVYCPECALPMASRPIEKVGNSKYLSLSQCKKHGDFASLWTIHKCKFTKGADTFYCCKSVMPRTDIVKEYYKTKAKINAEKREQHEMYLRMRYAQMQKDNKGEE